VKNVGSDQEVIYCLIIANVENQKNGNENDGCVYDLSQEFWNGNAMPFLEVQFENVALDQSNEKRSAENYDRRAKMMQESPLQVEEEGRGIDREASRQQVIQDTEANAVCALQPAPTENQQAIKPGDA